MASNEEKENHVLPNYEEIIREIWRIVQTDDKLELFHMREPVERPATGEKLTPLQYENDVFSPKLTLQFWFVKELFLFVRPKLLERTLDVEDQKAYLTAALLVHSGMKTFWNMRRELMTRNELDLAVELRLINLILSYVRKCEGAIYYRQWLLRDKLTEKPFDFLVSELSQMENMADHHGKNNHVPWEYCTWLIGQCESRPDFADLLLHAWHHSGQYMSCHMNDVSHFIYRGNLVARIIRSRDLVKNQLLKIAKESATKEGIKGLKEKDALAIGMIVHELNLNTSLMKFWGTQHEGVWTYRRFLVWLWKEELPNIVSEHGDRRLQVAGGCISDHFCAFDMYLNVHLQKKFFKIIKLDQPLAKKYKEWVAEFLPGSGCWDDEWLVPMSMW